MDKISYRCYFCEDPIIGIRPFVSHLRTFHPLETSPFTCGIDKCLDIFHSVGTFRNHIYYKHKGRWNGDVGGFVTDEETAFDQVNDTVHAVCASGLSNQGGGSQCSPDDIPDINMYEACMQDLSHQSTVLRLSLRYEHGIPSSKVNSIVSRVTDMIKGFKSSYDECLVAQLPNISSEAKVLLEDAVSLDSALDSSQSKERVELQKLGFVEPIEIVYSSPSSDVKDCGHYVPIESTLQKYLSRPDVFANIQREHVVDNVLDKMSAGLIMNRHTILAANRSSIRLVLYSDAFQIAGPLGPHTKSNSICGLYFSVNNIESKFSSKLLHIHLAMLVKEQHIKKYSRGVVFARLTEDLKRLQSEGMTVEVEGVKHHLIVVPVAYSGDNKELHEVGAFSATFSSGKVCRACLVDFKELQSIFCETQCVLRTVEGHNYHVESVLQFPSLSKVYGVQGPSFLSEVEYFHPVTSLVNDIMHDVFEGLMPFTIYAVVRGLIKNTTLTMDQIKMAFTRFNYGNSDKKLRPTIFPSKFPGTGSSLSGTATEKVGLFYLFSLVLGSKVPLNNEYWQLYLKCQEVCDILLAPVIQPDLTAVLSQLIREFHTQWSKLPVDVVGNVKPKMHYLIHTPRLALIFGPLRHLACMKFEHFHQLFKEEARHAHNFINPTLTLSNYFQKRRCLQYSATNIFVTEFIDSAQVTIKVSSLDSCEKEVVVPFFEAKMDSYLLSVTKAKLECVSLTVGEFVVLDINHENVPIFLKIVNILKYHESWAVVGRLMFPVCWSVHFHAFEMEYEEDGTDCVCVSPREILPMQTLSLYKVGGKCLLKLRHLPLKVE